ncbi:phenylalanine racemase [Phormidesmis priestleyi ULC007]|uniref:Phenylalanine racemase n=1 Tax=Phormidesmis priestleyi ULC007 TaxID=1920490 RepID=A0A2T1DNB5_9CYAN|nr:amino acid adenylation domain-containing protein [Phormidesmis priestleyi]PSB21959.1 phenylalanine racemase [Phormidesmis priestleyi ULC007]PZO55072.1 MAG: amino acid adenylation domain-containing protein [Phormidesmis priestleyi]
MSFASASVAIHQLIELQTLKTPDAAAIVFQNQRLTYRELNQKANQLAHYLQILGVKPETLVGICVERSLDMLVALLGILKAGGAYVPLDPSYPQDRLAFVIEDTQLPVLITQQHLCAILPQTQHAQLVCLDTDWQTVAQQSEANPESSVTAENLAYAIYTSGSTGKPKGVQITHQAVVNFLRSMQAEPGLCQQDVLLAITTISFDIAVLELFLPLIVGAEILLVSRDIASSGTLLSNLLSESNATVMQATPATWRMLVAAGWKGNKPLKMLCGGEALTRSLADQLLERGSSLWQMYGPTETTVWSMVHHVEFGDRAVPLGHAIANTQIYIVQEPARRKNDSLQIVSGEGEGEIYIGGQGVSQGYLNRPDLTREKFIPDPFSADPNVRLYKTGDLARLLPNGDIEMIGRIDHQVKIRGYRIELGDIETALSQHPNVRESVVITREDESGERRLVAYVVLKAQSLQLRSTELRAWLKDKLPEYMVPAIVVFMENLPLTPNLKVDRRALPVPTLDAQEEFVSPRTELERQLAQIWTAVLGVEVGIYHNFFESGGDSLRTALLLSRVREAFQVELSLDCLFKAPTVAGFAEVIQAVQSCGSTAGFNTTPTELWADANLDDAIRPHAISALHNSDAVLSELRSGLIAAQPIFLTGATGFIGAFLLQELLLHNPQMTAYCLVRADDCEAASDRLRKSLERYELWQDTFGSRIIPVLGDLSQPLFGLSESQFRELADRVDVIYHSGAYVNLVYPYTALRNANVLGTQEVLRLATQTRTLPVHYISTIDVFHSSEYEEATFISETDQLLSCDGYTEGYAQSKWVAEKLVMQARDRGLPVCIYRLGMITGHSQTGAFQLNNMICRLIKGFIQLGCAPELDLKMSLAPVDYIVQAIRHLSSQPASFGQTFHLVSPHLFTLKQLVADLNVLDYWVTLMPYQQWQTKLLAMPPENALTSMASMFTKRPDKQQTPIETATFVSQAFDTRNTDIGLDGTDIVCAPIDSSVLRIYLLYFMQNGFLPQNSQLTCMP